ncbi:HepT-like ribonuclease domain-containing protein [Arenibacter algicola]|nr:HepT-like ribonuclease domain-containing protein [Arenibacter algicola]
MAHEYDNISDEVIWTIIVRELPKLKEEIIKIKK